MMKKNILYLLAVVASVFAICLPAMGQDPDPQAPRGIFSVGPNRYVQFKEMNESKLMQWYSLPTEDAYGWRVLTSDEWSYLLVTRDDAEHYNTCLNNLGRIKTGEATWQNGLVILPDGWVQPTGVPDFVPVSTGIGYELNSYTSEQWAIMAASGAAFLPAEGYGHNSPTETKKDDPDKIENVTTHGSYWAADEHSENTDKAHCMRFNDESGSSDVHDLNNQTKYAYYSVRLARTVVILDEMDETDAFLEKLPEACAKSFALMRRTLYKDGYFNTICLPFDVPNIEASPLVGAEVYTFDGGTVSGTTGDEQLNLSVSPLAGNRLSAGVPYLIQWANTGEVMTFLRFDGVENWVAAGVSEAPSDPGNENIKFHGLYPRKRIPGYLAGDVPHYNFFVDAENTLLWPDDSQYPTSKMKGFRAYLYLEGGGPNGHSNGPSGAARYRNMPAVWHIQSTATGVENVQGNNVPCAKIIENGALFIMYKGTMYDVQGNKVSTK